MTVQLTHGGGLNASEIVPNVLRLYIQYGPRGLDDLLIRRQLGRGVLENCSMPVCILPGRRCATKKPTRCSVTAGARPALWLSLAWATRIRWVAKNRGVVGAAFEACSQPK